MGEPVQIVDPLTHDAYVLVRAEVYAWLARELPRPGDQPSSEIPPVVLRSQQAFWHDLPELLKNKRNRGKWVAYHGDERIGIAGTEAALIQECIRRGLKDDEFDLDVIEPHALPPWESETIEPGGHEESGSMLHDPPRRAAMPR
jgi:hypothetical protein